MTTAETHLLTEAATHIDALRPLDVFRDRDAVIRELRELRSSIDSAPDHAPDTQWLLLEHQVGGMILAATGLNQTAQSLLHVWANWLQRTGQRITERLASSDETDALAAWIEEARGYTQDSMRLLR